MDSSNNNNPSATTSTRPSSIDEALRLLDNVINRDGANLRDLITTEYANLRRAINDFAPNMGDKVRDYGTQAVDQASVYAQQGMEQGRVIAAKVDTQVRANPWPVIGGVALASLAFGFMLGRSGEEIPETGMH
jgi:ElaB/YqjD/DUF883 family membrane-anchored ribosome-binding protein